MNSKAGGLLDTWLDEFRESTGGTRADAAWKMRSDLGLSVSASRFNEWADPAKTSRTPSAPVVNYMLQTSLPAVLRREGLDLSDDALQRVLSQLEIPYVMKG